MKALAFPSPAERERMLRQGRERERQTATPARSLMAQIMNTGARTHDDKRYGAGSSFAAIIEKTRWVS
jgi:hypothetical protein